MNDLSTCSSDFIRGVAATAPRAEGDAYIDNDIVTYSSPFPADFVFGVAAAAAQIEGAAFEDGKGESIWVRFCRTRGKGHDGDTLDVACDHSHGFAEDFALMAALGLRK